MRRPSRWALAGAVTGAVIATSVWLPARWLQPLVSQASQGRVVWLETTGTVWDGHTRIALTGGAGSQDRALLPGVWSWQLRPDWLSGPGAALRITAGCCLTQAVQVTAHWQSGTTAWHVSDAQLHTPLTALRGLGTPWNTLELQGQLQLNTVGLQGTARGSRADIRGHIKAQVSHVSSRLTTVAPLGDYAAELAWPQQALAQWSVRTLSGHLDIQGQGQIAQGRVRFRGQASASPETETALANLLNIIGRRQGRVTLLTLG